MSSSDSHDGFPPDSGPVFSREAVTPRGGFMARPGLKPPPRHAVVVRGGDAAVSETIPVARSSFPPAGPSEPPSALANEKATVRAIPAARVPRFASVEFNEPQTRGSALQPPAVQGRPESAPPPSDSPVVHSIPPEVLPRPRRKTPGWAVFAAGAAGLILGLASVLAARSSVEGPRAGAPAPLTAPTAADGSPAARHVPVVQPSSAAPSAREAFVERPSNDAPDDGRAKAAPRAAVTAAKKSIF